VFRAELDTYAGVRRDCGAYTRYGLFDRNKLETNLDARNFNGFLQVFARVKPDVVINCVGIIKQLSNEVVHEEFRV
jgi:dTDP-4-dehydrorhamnose reductase